MDPHRAGVPRAGLHWINLGELVVKDTLNILTRKAKGMAHQQTVLEIDWAGLDQEQMMVLARSAIINAVQAHMRRTSDPIPEQLQIKATEFVRGELHEVLVDRPQPPRHQTGAVQSQLERMLAALTPEERNKLLGI